MEELIKRLRELKIINYEPVELKHAGTSEYYVDIKEAYGDSKALNLISENLMKIIPKETTCIAASGYGGLPAASVISSKNNFNLTLIRDTPKKHGRGGLIDGYVPNKEDKISIIDDVFTTGGSLKKNIKALESTGAEILGCYVVVKRRDTEVPFNLEYLLTAEELI